MGDLAEPMEQRVLMASIVVDDPGPNPSPGHLTLPEAVALANANPGADTPGRDEAPVPTGDESADRAATPTGTADEVAHALRPTLEAFAHERDLEIDGIFDRERGNRG